MALPTTTRGSSIVEKTPTSADVQAAMFQTPEAADYLLQRLTTRLEGLGWMEKAQDVWERIREYDDVINQLAGFRSDCWAGSLETPFHNMHKKLAQDARKSINEAVKDPIKLDYALNNELQCLLHPIHRLMLITTQIHPMFKHIAVIIIGHHFLR